MLYKRTWTCDTTPTRSKESGLGSTTDALNMNVSGVFGGLGPSFLPSQ